MIDLQRTEEWYQARLGKVTASRIVDVMSKGRGSAPSITRQKYLVQLALERVTGKVVESYSNAAMQRGTENEPLALEQYAFIKGVKVEPVGFVPHPSIPMAGASPDGLVNAIGPDDSDGLVEVKCPESHTHWNTLKGEPIPRRYIYQMHWQMACTGRYWCDFISFDPRFPPEQQLHIQRVDCDTELYSELIDGVRDFLDDLEKELSEVTGQEVAA